MKVVYVPLFRLATGYVVNVGRKWSVLEQALLIELASSKLSTRKLAAISAMPERLVMEALINLLRAGWVEVRSTEKGAVFGATAAGKRRAKDEILPDQVQRATRWTSLCVERLTGSWMRADDLELVYENDLPLNAERLESSIHTFDLLSGSVRGLLRLNTNESLEPVEPTFSSPSRPYARVVISQDKIDGVPSYAPLEFRGAILDLASDGVGQKENLRLTEQETADSAMQADIEADDIIVGGNEHFEFIKTALSGAHSHVVIHSCFLEPKAITKLLPALQAAAARGVRVDLLWGMRDPTDSTAAPLKESEKVLAELTATARARVQLSPVSSGSHAKVLIYDEKTTGEWVTAIGSCNFLSSLYTAVEVSVACRSHALGLRMVSELIYSQLPASGAWSQTARRLNRLWEAMRFSSSGEPEIGSHSLTLLCDQDHYACVRAARDLAKSEIAIGCDLYGAAAETSVLVPMGRAAELGRTVKLVYNRPSKALDTASWDEDLAASMPTGVSIKRAHNLHGKFLWWDDSSLAITSFNWLSTVASDARARGAEFGVLISGPNVVDILRTKLAKHEVDVPTASQVLTAGVAG